MSVYKETHPRTGKMRYRIHVEWTYPDGRRRTIRKVSPVATQRGAEQYERDIRNALADGTYDKRKASLVPTLAKFHDRYFSDHVSKLKPSSQEAQTDIWRISLLPALGDVPIDQVDDEAIAKLTRLLRVDRKLSPKSTNNALSSLRTALACAEEWKLISAVPRIRWLKVPQQKFDYFSFDEADRLVKQGGLPMATVAVRTGMRIGELLALQWSDVDLESRTVLVERSVYWAKGSKPHEGGTKTGKVRALRLTGEAVAALQTQQPSPKKRRGYVFADSKGRQLTRNACRRPLWNAEAAAGLRRTGWHVCRHTFASHLVMRGVPLASVQQLMGHTTIAMTMKYAHLAPDHLRSAMDVLEAPGVLEVPEGPNDG